MSSIDDRMARLRANMEERKQEALERRRYYMRNYMRERRADGRFADDYKTGRSVHDSWTYVKPSQQQIDDAERRATEPRAGSGAFGEPPFSQSALGKRHALLNE